METATHHKVNRWTIHKAAAVRVALKRLGRKSPAEGVEFWGTVITPTFDNREHMITGNGPIRCTLCGEATLPGGDIKLDNLGYCPTCKSATGDITHRLFARPLWGDQEFA